MTEGLDLSVKSMPFSTYLQMPLIPLVPLWDEDLRTTSSDGKAHDHIREPDGDCASDRVTKLENCGFWARWRACMRTNLFLHPVRFLHLLGLQYPLPVVEYFFDIGLYVSVSR